MADIDDDESGSVAAIAAAIALTTLTAAVDNPTRVYLNAQPTFRSFIHFVEHANPHVVYRFRFGASLHFQNCNTFSPCRFK